MELPQAFGLTLKKKRNKVGLSQEALAFECSLDRTYISLLERGRRQPSLTTIFLIADALEQQPEALIKETKIKAKKK